MKDKNLSYISASGFVPPGITAGEYFENAVANFPDKVAIVFKDKKYTYKQLGYLVNQLSISLVDLGVKKGDRVAVCMPNWPEFVVASQAILNIGAIKVPISTNYRKMEMMTILKHSEAKAIVLASHVGNTCLTDIVNEVLQEVPSLSNVIVKGETPSNMISFDNLIDTDWSKKYKSNYIEEVYKKTYQIEADDIAAIVYTSGTTGKPKGVTHTHNSIYRGAFASNITRKVTENDVWLGMNPLTAGFGTLYVEPCFIIGCSTMVLLESFNPEEALQEIEKNKVTSPLGVPTMFIRMLNHPNFCDYNVSSLRNAYIGGAAAPEEMMQNINDKFGCSITMTYGATEFCHATMTNLEDPIDVVIETSGLPLYGGAEVKIVNDKGKIVPLEEVGLICVRSFARFVGYHNNPEKTAETMDEKGWICVGDLGKMDNFKRLIVLGRKVDMVVRGGQNIYTDEVESVISTYPKVEQISIIGYPDSDLGERTCAFIKLRSGFENIDREELSKFLKDKVAKYKIPDRIQLVQEFPMVPTGKINKNILRDSLKISTDKKGL